jgi:hypothetical protein
VSSGLAPVAQFHYGLSGSQTINGACRSEGFGYESACTRSPRPACGELNLRDPRAALSAQATLGALIALAVERVRGGGDRGFHQPPPQIPRPVLGQRPRRSISPD